MTHIAYISIGSNMGDAYQNCVEAIHKISKNESITIISKSSFYQTSPIGNIKQAWFINSVIKIKSPLTPEDLLSRLLNIESEMGRIRKERWGPRLIDLDLLFYDNLILNKKDITLPHPEIQKRKFILIPLDEIAGYYSHPSLKKTIKFLLTKLSDNSEVKKLSAPI